MFRVSRVDVPGRVKRSDDLLDHILWLRHEQAKRESEFAATEWCLSYILALLDVWSDSPLHERLKVVAEIRAIAREMELDEMPRPEMVLESELQLPGSEDSKAGED